ncbi:PIG-L family deacetylase [Granulosicoccus sp. 3-233]|uniref:PIG-L family deacetylase n=1 Tax=Granulosicoccus sp. 3-233 TaxID=3417969 RepID=UPI003D356823
MTLSDVDRLDAEHARPRALELHQALAKLPSCVSFMNTGAHPDDETSAMLAALGFRDGLDISYACANRGEGGQNDIGTEAQAALGTLRTAEMEKAAAVLDLRLYWLSESPEDSVFDFGFSKNGEETLVRWQHERTLQRFVSIVRRERPDILCPTFLDIPGQHGHHRAMTAMAHLVMDRAADPAYECDSLPPWTISKLYLPAWGGGGTAYDDELPPPPTTLTISADGHDDWTGWTWENIGQQSRRYHRTQGMGRWVHTGNERNWPLHLARSRVDGPDDTLVSGLPRNLAELAEWVSGSSTVRGSLLAAHEAIDRTLEAFPDFPAVARHASKALVLVQSAMQQCPDDARDQMLHRLQRKKTQLSRVIRLALGIRVHAHFPGQNNARSGAFWQPGEQRTCELELDTRLAQTMGSCKVKASIRTDGPWTLNNGALALDGSAPPSNPYPDTWLPDRAATPCIEVRIAFNKVVSTCFLPLDEPPVILPATRAVMSPEQVLINTRLPQSPIDVTVRRPEPATAEAQLQLPDGWQLERTADVWRVTPAAALDDGLYELPLLLDAKQAMQVDTIHYPHTQARAISTAARVSIRAMSIELPDVRVGYAGGGNDDVEHWLVTMGLPVTSLTDQDLESAASLTQWLKGIDTLVIGLFAYRSRTQLSTLSQTINDWVESGGHLLTLYHRPWDNWDPRRIPPRMLEIGQPSLRYRVTDENADVQHLLPEHPLLNAPNRITPADWQGWHKERGLYFAKAWDEAYAPLLSMADPGESPHTGALLCAEHGRGRHIHTSLILHHQMNQLVPGAFRLMANLVS